MEEERLMFKAYQRSLLRSFCALKEALHRLTRAHRRCKVFVEIQSQIFHSIET